MTSLKLLFGTVAVASLSACGGGASLAPVSSAPAPATTPAPAPAPTPAPAPAPAAGSVPSPSGTPTTALVSTQAEATGLATEAKSGLAAAAGGSAGAGVKTPFGIETSALPTAVATTIQCSQLAAGGTGNVTVDVPSTAPAAGYTITLAYNACSFSGYSYNGTAAIVYDSYVSPTNYAASINYQNFSVSGNGLTSQAVNGKVSCTYSGTASSCYYNDGTRGWSSTMSYANGTANGSYAVNYGAGSIQVVSSNFGATGGTATITGANGSKAVITRNSATSFTVSITSSAGGAATAYTVTL
ncbi:MAG: hypothetical protein RLZZ401_531 [Pseudomonadota bacterium]